MWPSQETARPTPTAKCRSRSCDSPGWETRVADVVSNRPQAHTHHLGGARAVSSCGLQRAFQELTFSVAQGNSGLERGRALHFGRGLEMREEFRAEHMTIRKSQRTANEILQLAHIPRPAMRLETRGKLRGDVIRRPGVRSVLPQEMPGKFHNVFAAFSQRRHGQPQHLHPVVET